MSQTVVQIDAFTDRPFAGNPAAVCIMDGPADAGWMQSVALEMNLSETAFLYPKGDRYSLRWFTPTVEAEMCGHATLASAHLLFEDGHASSDQTLLFDTLSGELRASKSGDWIMLDFPAVPPAETDAPDGLIDAIGVEPLNVSCNGKRYLAQLPSEEAVRSLTPDITKLASLPIRNLIVTAEGSGEYDFVSRNFAPAMGIAEDPVTGSAHCTLGPFWQPKLGKDDMLAFQASKRGGTVRVRIAGDRVLFGGRAVITMRGELT
jgi:PhzF family phenazine biosynthesis protein